jgi:hypothetical protein
MTETNFRAEVGFAPDVAGLARPEKPAKPPILCIFKSVHRQEKRFSFLPRTDRDFDPGFSKEKQNST